VLWDFDDDFWDLDPEDFAIIDGVAGRVEEEMEEEDLLEKEVAGDFDEGEDDL
jgi:hypothetical protein